MKNIKTPLHILLTTASLLGFLGGWATLAHSRKPVQNTSSDGSSSALDPLPPLDPLPALNSSSANSGGSNSLFSIAPQQSVRPRSRRPVFTTSGS